MNTYVINLKRSESRRLAIETQLKQLKVPYSIIEAVDGEMLEQEFFERVRPGADTRRGEVACTLSHLKVYKTFTETSQDKFALILEDDSLINESDLSSLLQDWEKHCDDTKITLLTYYWCREGKLELYPIARSGRYSFCKPAEAWGVARAGAYIISRDCAQKILDYHGDQVKCAADNWITYQKEKTIEGITCMFPQPVAGNNIFGSDIDYVETRFGKMVKRLFDIAVANRLPVISSSILKRRERVASKYKNIILIKEVQEHHH